MFVVVGGHSRNIGKTAVAAAIIRELSDLNWTAVKVTQHGHGICAPVGEPCGCSIEYEHPFALSEEQDPTTGTDSARFLAAGALRAYWLRAPVGQLGHAVPAFRRLLESSENLIAESNSVLQYFQPDLYLPVLDFGVEDFKDSALKYLDRADALVTVGSPRQRTWERV
ncbi:MAG: hypothetical protein ACKV22_07005, partial [Bryobacteraceae bacterium]